VIVDSAPVAIITNFRNFYLQTKLASEDEKKVLAPLSVQSHRNCTGTKAEQISTRCEIAFTVYTSMYANKSGDARIKMITVLPPFCHFG
jgi:hypothetical protein